MTMAMEELLEQEYPDYFTAENIDKMADEERKMRQIDKNDSFCNTKRRTPDISFYFSLKLIWSISLVFIFNLVDVYKSS